MTARIGHAAFDFRARFLAPLGNLSTGEIAYCNRIGCSCPNVLTLEGTDVTGTVPRK